MARFFVKPDTGNDGNPGTLGSPWATTQKGLDTVTQPDELGLINSATETTAAVIDADTNAGLTLAPINILGVDAAGDELTTGFYTIQASAVIAAILQIAAIGFLRFRRIRFEGNANAASCLLQTVDSGNSHAYTHCRFDGATSHGLNIRINPCVLTNCEIDGHGGNGINHQSANRGSFKCLYVKIHDNTLSGWVVNGGQSYAVNSEIYDNLVDGIHLGNFGDIFLCDQSVFFKNGINGFDLGTGENAQILNSTFVDQDAGWGVDFAGDIHRVIVFENNHTNNNDLGAFSLTSPGQNHQTGDPLFTSIVDGLEDFRPTSGSPLLSNGLLGSDIGPYGLADTGGLIIHPGMAGGMRG